MVKAVIKSDRQKTDRKIEENSKDAFDYYFHVTVNKYGHGKMT